MTQLSPELAQQLESQSTFVQAPKVSLFGRVFPFPNPVNEYAARFTAGIVVLIALAALISGSIPLLAILTGGFLLRLAWGPKISPAGILSVKVLAPMLGKAKMVPGPPKRFAQGIGAVLSGTALILAITGTTAIAWLLIVLLAIAASLEAILGFCLGCAIFGFLQRRGIIPASVCEACAKFSAPQSAPNNH